MQAIRLSACSVLSVGFIGVLFIVGIPSLIVLRSFNAREWIRLIEIAIDLQVY